MAMDIGSLAPGMNEHGLELGTGRKGLRKTWGPPHSYFLGALTL
jgi:hypothetical protein